MSTNDGAGGDEEVRGVAPDEDGAVTSRSPSHIGIKGPLGEAIGPVTEGSIVLLGGPPGIGKSLALYQCAVDFESQCEDVLFFSFEESKGTVETHLRDFGARLDESSTIHVVSAADVAEAEDYAAKFPVRRILVDGLSYHRRADLHRVLTSWREAGIVVIVSFHTSRNGGVVSRYRHVADVTVDVEKSDTGTMLLHRRKTRYSPVGTVAANLTKLGFVRSEWKVPERAVVHAGRTRIPASARAALEAEVLRFRTLYEDEIRHAAGHDEAARAEIARLSDALVTLAEFIRTSPGRAVPLERVDEALAAADGVKVER